MPIRLDDELERAQKALAAITQGVAEMRLAITGGEMKAQPVKDCNKLGAWAGVEACKQRVRGDSWGTPSAANIVAAARAHVEEMWAESKAIHEANLPVIENNKKLRARLDAFMSSIGFSAEYSTFEYKTNRSRNRETVTHTAGWVGDKARLLPITDGFEYAERDYQRLLKEITEWERKEKQKEQEVERAKAIEVRKTEGEKLRAVMVVKYGLEFTASLNEVKDALLARDKYLALADALQRNRGDWSDGCWYAENGLGGFAVETEVDKQIYECLSPLISDWDGDGRVFRDCEFNYDRIFAMAEDGVRDDYFKLSEYLEND